MNRPKSTQVATPSEPDSADRERVVLLDEAGNAIGTADKVAVHTSQTPLHLAFSCYVFNADGAILMTRRALDKRVFPGVWTNSVCGHPAAGEELAEAARRRARDELGLQLHDPRLVLPGFRYQAEMSGILENEACPVLTARAFADPVCNPSEVADWLWVDWTEFVALVLDDLVLDDLVLVDTAGLPGRVLSDDFEISPWCRLQVAALSQLGPVPDRWPVGDPAQLPAALPAW